MSMRTGAVCSYNSLNVLPLMLSGPHVLCGLALHERVSEYLVEILRAMLFQGVGLDLCLGCCFVFLVNTD
jgi:putative Ca2+/H+ antiporter (TMEM165/GDT1 family)